jgi:hypothetical protein
MQDPDPIYHGETQEVQVDEVHERQTGEMVEQEMQREEEEDEE